MSQYLRYGKDSALRFDVPSETLVADCTAVPGQVLEDPSARVSACLAEPLGFPPLARAIVPGDRVVISVDPNTPQPCEIISGVVRTLLAGNVRPSDIVVLQTRADVGHSESLARTGSDGVEVVHHDPRDRSQLSYLAASAEANPIYLNRHLCDADFVLPINLTQPEASFGYGGIYGGLYPTFSDAQAPQRFRAAVFGRKAGPRQRCCAEAEEVAWLLGVQLSVQIVAGPGNTTLHALAGLADEVARRSRELVDAAWSIQVPRKASLVIAAIEGDADDQSWENFGRALYAASRVCADQGTIVLCTDLKRKPGPALRRLAVDAQDAELRRQIRHEKSDDAMSASLLLETRNQQRVCLLSRLAEEVVEGIGVGYIADPRQVRRLSEQHDSCILLANAHRAAPHAMLAEPV
ncbi:MAG: DUF2088 domain-containing protein [Planctomycetes bacterium]|nr:DUF2088 domain-containing protein [Planctomycetota bacterium]